MESKMILTPAPKVSRNPGVDVEAPAASAGTLSARVEVPPEGVLMST